jgi:hypothetical protein
MSILNNARNSKKTVPVTIFMTYLQNYQNCLTLQTCFLKNRGLWSVDTDEFMISVITRNFRLLQLEERIEICLNFESVIKNMFISFLPVGGGIYKCDWTEKIQHQSATFV